MAYKCSVKGVAYPESEGITWKQLRPSIQEFIKTFRADWNDDDFISYDALNDLMRAYIANINAEEIKEHQALARKIQERFATEDQLRPMNMQIEAELTFGEKLADKIASFGGSWGFIIIFFLVLLIWMGINVYALRNRGFDPYPFILLNLVLSCLAAIQAPVIMMSQNRQEDKDRARNEYDFKVNVKAEAEVRLLHEKIDHLLLHQHQNMVELFQLNLDLMQQIQQRWDALDSRFKTKDQQT
jgi:uncharacterized membrane protein